MASGFSAIDCQPAPALSTGSPGGHGYLGFSLRTFLVVFVLLAIACGLIARRIERKRREAALIQRLSDRAAFGLSRQEPTWWQPPWLEPLLGPDFFDEIIYVEVPHATDDDVRQIANLKHVLYLEISTWAHAVHAFSDPAETTEISDDALARVGRMTSLRELTICNRRLADSGLKHLRRMTSLRALTIVARLEDADLAFLGSLDQLEVLRISLPNGDDQAAASFTDEGLAQLEKLTRLRILDLQSFRRATDAGLLRLAGMTQLEDLSLESDQITDAGLRHLQALGRLHRVAISGRQITDAGLVNLQAMRQLKHVCLARVSVTQAGIDALQCALPGCGIHYCIH
jgi:hypothetical protein